MIDIDTLFKNYNDDYEKWSYLYTSDSAVERFLVLLIPMLEYTYQCLVDAHYHHISEDLLLRLIKDDLCSTLTNLISRLCVFELHSARANHLLFGETPKNRFDYFIEQLKSIDNRLAIIKKYPLLKKQLDILVNQFISVYSELFSRLHRDSSEVYQCFLNNDHSYILSSITPAGDKHCQGRFVMILEFINHKCQPCKLVYKPKSLAIDHAAQQFISFFNKSTSVIHLYEQEFLVKENYGWCKFIIEKSCESQEAIKRYYYRMGCLLMIAYLLNGSDLHYENIIAHGEYPVIIDYECFLKPFILFDQSDNQNPPRHLVTNMCFLPAIVMISNESTGIDISAFSGQGGEEIPYLVMEWEESGTDTMHMIRTQKRISPSQNIPLLNYNKIDPINYQLDFLNGFLHAYDVILEILPILDKPNSPLDVFKNVNIRVVFRETADYTKLLLESFHPIILSSEEKWHSHFSWLSKNDNTLSSFILASELNDLSQMNIPVFYCNSDGAEIFNSQDEKVNVNVIMSGLQCVLYNIKNTINSRDLYVQKQLIENSFEAMKLNKLALPNKSDTSSFVITKEIFNPDDLVTQSLKIAKNQLDQLNNSFVINRNRIFWPSIEILLDKTWCAGFTNISLYDGVSGIILSLAYGGIIFTDPQYTSTAQLGLESLRQTIKTYGIEAFSTVGAFTGIGGIIYTLANLYKLWKDESIKQDLMFILNFLPHLIIKDRYFDIVSGSSGCLLALLTLRGIISDKILNPLMDQCVQHIIIHYPVPSEFPLLDSLPINSTQPILGFSHGIAGIALALSQYNHIKPSIRLNYWITEALTYERSCFSKEENNWPDFRKNDEMHSIPRFMTAWCHGAPGIGIARLDMQHYWHDKLFNDEIEIAVNTTLKNGYHSYLNLCHGNLGNLELLFMLNEVKNTDLSKTQYLQQACNIIQSINKNGIKCGIASSESTPGLMTGTAGVSYQLMRVAYPDRVPSVLLLKTLGI